MNYLRTEYQSPQSGALSSRAEADLYAPVLFGSKWLWYQASGNKVFLNLNIPLLHNLGFGWSH